MADLYALYRLALEGAWIQSSLDRKTLSLRKNMAPIGFRASRTRVELATCEFQSSTATRGTGATSAERRGGSPTGPFTTTGILSLLVGGGGPDCLQAPVGPQPLSKERRT